MAGRQVEVPREWNQLTIERMNGTLLVVGAPNVGKTTFAQYVYRRLCAGSSRAAYLDGDPGQSTLGPPTTLTASLGAAGSTGFPPRGQVWRRFVGAVSPRGHMLPMLVGASRLVQAAAAAGAQTVVYDTSGLVDPSQGGLALKLALVDLVRPSVVFALQYDRELESLLVPLRRSQRVRVVDVRPVLTVQRRDVADRRAYRARQFARYFGTPDERDERRLKVDWGRLAVLPSVRFPSHRLLAFEDAGGFVLGLGIVIESDPRARKLTVCTPLASLDSVDGLRLGDVAVDPVTLRDRRLTATSQKPPGRRPPSREDWR